MHSPRLCTAWHAVAIATALAAPIPASAQTDTYARISVSATQIYDGNLFATPASRAPQADLISRIGPAFEAGYLSPPFAIDARYEIQAERYLDHPDLDANAAHQDATLAVRYRPMPRFTLRADAAYIATQTPAQFNVGSQLNIGSQLGVGRTPAERVTMAATGTYEWSKVTTATLEYAFGRDALIGSAPSVLHRSRLGVRRKAGLRNIYRADYEIREVQFGHLAWLPSQVITAGWAHAITQRTGFEIAIGPRLTDGTIRPEVSAQLRRALSRGEVSLGYWRTELTAIGERGAIDVHRVAAGITYRPARRINLTATPAYSRSARGRQQVPVYTLDLESMMTATRSLSLVGWARIGRQEGTLSGLRDTIPYRTLGVKLMIAFPAGPPAGGLPPS